EVARDGSVWQQEYARGRPASKLRKVKDSSKTGTIVAFWPDEEIFEELVFKREVLAERLQELSFLTRGVEIALVDEREDPANKTVFKASGGLADFVKHLSHGKESIHNKVIHFVQEREGGEVEVAMQWNSGYA